MIWVPLQAVLTIHDRQISRHRGAPGLRDHAALEAALARPQNKAAYGETDFATLAAAYAYGLAKAHAFVDGNKRTAFVTMATFLALNGVAFRPEPMKGVRMMVGLAAGEISEKQFEDRVRADSLAI